MNLILLFDWNDLRTRFIHLPETKAPACVKARIGEFVVILEDDTPPIPG